MYIYVYMLCYVMMPCGTPSVYLQKHNRICYTRNPRMLDNIMAPQRPTTHVAGLYATGMEQHTCTAPKDAKACCSTPALRTIETMTKNISLLEVIKNDPVVYKKVLNVFVGIR